jgi:hypothetical protein
MQNFGSLIQTKNSDNMFIAKSGQFYTENHLIKTRLT